MMRREDWRERLFEHVEEFGRLGFAWDGRHCISFVLGAAVAMTDHDPWRGSWRKVKSERDAIKLVRRLGGVDHAAILATEYPETARAFARDGDIAIVATQEGRACGLFIGDAILALEPGGMVRLPRDAASIALLVG